MRPGGDTGEGLPGTRQRGAIAPSRLEVRPVGRSGVRGVEHLGPQPILAWFIVGTYPHIDADAAGAADNVKYEVQYAFGAIGALCAPWAYLFISNFFQLGRNDYEQSRSINAIGDLLAIIPLVIDLLINREAWSAGVLGVILLNIGLKAKEHVYSVEVPEKIRKAAINVPKGVPNRSSAAQKRVRKLRRVRERGREAAAQQQRSSRVASRAAGRKQRTSRRSSRRVSGRVSGRGSGLGGARVDAEQISVL